MIGTHDTMISVDADDLLAIGLAPEKEELSHKNARISILQRWCSQRSCLVHCSSVRAVAKDGSRYVSSLMLSCVVISHDF